ncbi:MAG: Hsp70 family protein [Desulfobacteraceae bacterium]|nr:Hsp70 family protein [Desulfobacteraceae bacterium]
MSEPVYIIGLDLGTTNSIVAYTEADTDKIEEASVRVFDIPQLVEAGVVKPSPVLPSFVMLAEGLETAEEALALPWSNSHSNVVGEYARYRGEEIPQRLISSSKSWLCNTFVDRNAQILPWDAGASAANNAQTLKKLSPVQASALILEHIRDSWNHVMAGSSSEPDEGLRFENQLIYLTVPASFDAVARELTVKAANMAGLSNFTLLEEPQAAFYSWIASTQGGWREQVSPGDLILVCDVGGGTTDFSLIKAGQEDGDLVLDRIAVGNHLLVGGDNMDLALAYSLSNQLKDKGTRLDSWQMNSLWHTCRSTKERILSDPGCEMLPVSILGRGASLIGGAITAELTRDTIEKVIRDGFFPVCASNEKPSAVRRTGIREFGLAFESDPAITKHLATFLDRHDDSGRPLAPTAVLFNGGVMKAGLLREQIVSVLNSWNPNGRIRELGAQDFDLAVARGAAYYGLACQGKGIRIRGGLGRSYYIGIAAAMPAVPGMPVPIKALCVAPFGTEEGTTAAIEDQEFVLLVGEEAKFDFLGSTLRPNDKIGTIVEDWQDEIEDITTVETVLKGENRQAIPVNLELRVTEVGTLELWCVSKTGQQKWKLEFNVRNID